MEQLPAGAEEDGGARMFVVIGDDREPAALHAHDGCDRIPLEPSVQAYPRERNQLGGARIGLFLFESARFTCNVMRSTQPRRTTMNEIVAVEETPSERTAKDTAKSAALYAFYCAVPWPSRKVFNTMTFLWR